MNGRQGVDALARAIQNAADQVDLPGQEGGVQAVGEHLVPVLNGTERSDGGLKVFVHDFDHVHTGLLVEGDVRLHGGFARGNLLGKVKREERGNVVYWLSLDSSQHSFALVHLCRTSHQKN